MNRLRLIAACLVACLMMTPTVALAHSLSPADYSAKKSTSKKKQKTPTKKKKKPAKKKKKVTTTWTTTALVNSADEYGINLTFSKPPSSLAAFLNKNGGRDQDVNDSDATVTVDGETALLESLCDGMTATVKVKQYKNELYLIDIKAQSAECYATGDDGSADDSIDTGDGEYDYALVAQRR